MSSRHSNVLRQIVLCAIIAVGFTTSLTQRVTAEPSVVFVEPISANEKSLLTGIISNVTSSFKSRFGLDLDKGTKIFISESPENLAGAHARHFRGSSDKIERYRDLSSAEAKYRALFISVGSKRYPSRSKIRRANLVFHEYFHLLQYELVGKKSRKCCRSDGVPVMGPIWLMEGSAEYYARMLMQSEGYESMSGYLQHIRRNYRANGLQTLKTLESRHGMDRQRKSYDIAAFAVHKLVEQAGPASVPKFYSLLRKSSNWKKAFELSFGISTDSFYKVMKSVSN